MINANPSPVPVEWERFPKSLTESIDCAINAVYLLHHGDEPYVAVLQPKSDHSRVGEPVGARPVARARAGGVDEILAQADGAERLPRRVLSLEPCPKGTPGSGYGPRAGSDTGADDRGAYTIRFHELPDVDRSQIILPRRCWRRSNGTCWACSPTRACSAGPAGASDTASSSTGRRARARRSS